MTIFNRINGTFARRFLLMMTALLTTFSYAKQHVYFGTGSELGDGIYHSLLITKTGELSPPQKVADIAAPGFLALHPTLDVLYAVAVKNKKAVVAAYEQNADGSLTFLNATEIGDGRSAHIAVHPSGKLLLTAQYGGGSVALFPLAKDGSVQPRAQLIKHHGGSRVVGNRQNSPHPHWVGFTKDGRFAFVPDLGLDAAMVYRVDLANQQLVSHQRLDTIPGGGPRHMRLSADEKYLYLLNELALSVSVFEFDSTTGRGNRIAVTPTLAESIKLQETFNSASEIVVHNNDRFVYSANRGHDSVSVFSRNTTTGELTLKEVEAIRGAFPRNINLDNSSQWLFAAGQHSNTISVFSVDDKTGLLQFQQGSSVQVPEPICIVFAEAN